MLKVSEGRIDGRNSHNTENHTHTHTYTLVYVTTMKRFSSLFFEDV